MLPNELQRYPAWKHAADMIAAVQPQPGTMLTPEHLARLMSLELPRPDMRHDAAQKLELAFLANCTELRRWLGREHQIRIESRGALGYEVLAPADQITTSVKRREGDIRRALRHLRAEISWVPMDQLTDDERREAIDALARMGRLGAQLQQKRVTNWLPTPAP